MPTSRMFPSIRAGRRFSRPSFLARTLGLGTLVVLGVPAALLAPLPLSGQGVVVDQGTFRILSGGTVVGTEEFVIRRAGTGADQQVIATAEIELRIPEGNTSLVPLLQATGGDMAISGYQIKVSGSLQEEVSMRLESSRYLSRVRSERGEREREYRAAAGTVLLDPSVVHQYYFVAARLNGESATIPAISPREGRQYELRVTTVTRSTVVELVDGTATGRHLRLEGDGRTRELWVDDQGRVLRLEDPERGLTAIRTRAP